MSIVFWPLFRILSSWIERGPLSNELSSWTLFSSVTRKSFNGHPISESYNVFFNGPHSSISSFDELSRFCIGVHLECLCLVIWTWTWSPEFRGSISAFDYWHGPMVGYEYRVHKLWEWERRRIQFLLQLPCMPKLMRFSGKLSGTSYVVGYLWKQRSSEVLCREVTKVKLPNFGHLF